MATTDFFYKLETASIHFQSGVKRSVLIFAGFCLLFIVPIYFLGQGLGTFWSSAEFNPNRIIYKEVVNPKTTSVYNYRVDRTQKVSLINGETVFYTTINNQANKEVGFNPLVYNVQIIDVNGNLLSQERQKTYLLPGEVTYIVANSELEEAYDLRITEEPETQAILFNENANNFSRVMDNVEVRNPRVKNINGSQDLEMTAVIKNKNLFEIRELEVLYLIRSTRDRVIGIGKQKITNLLPGEERDFYLRYPQPKYRRPQSLDVRTFVNYLDQDNFIVQ